MALKPIQILINAKDEASAVFGRLQTKIAAVGVAVAGYFGIKAFGGAVKSAADFEAAMSRVEAATGASGKELEALKKAASDAGANTQFTASQAANALENLAKAGLSSTQSVQALNPVLNLATAADVELATAAEYVTKAVMGMGLSFDDAGRVADVLAKGANATNSSVTSLSEALSYAAPIAQTVGLTLEETTAIMGKLADAGIDASRSGTSLANILAQFSDPSSAFKKELAALGITTNDFNEALRQLEASGDKGKAAILAVGLNAGPALQSLLNQGMGSVDALALDGNRMLAVLNDSTQNRERLTLALSDNQGLDWRPLLTLADSSKGVPGQATNGHHEYSYPWIMLGADGLYHVLFTWNRERIRHVAFNQRWLDRQARLSDSRR